MGDFDIGNVPEQFRHIFLNSKVKRKLSNESAVQVDSDSDSEQDEKQQNGLHEYAKESNEDPKDLQKRLNFMMGIGDMNGMDIANCLDNANCTSLEEMQL